jgi:hypothetical protein
MRANRWSKSGVLDRVFLALQKERIIEVRVERLSLDSTSARLHPDIHGALKETAGRPSGSRAADGTQGFVWLPRMTRSS